MTTNSQLTKNFSRAELLVSNTAVRHGIDNTPDSPEVEANILLCAQFLQALRDRIGLPIRVLSCYRSPTVNKLVGGSPSSAHMRGLAVDFVCHGMPNKELARFVKANFRYDQLILEFDDGKGGGWVHVGIATEALSRGQDLTAVKVAGRTVYNRGVA